MFIGQIGYGDDVSEVILAIRPTSDRFRSKNNDPRRVSNQGSLAREATNVTTTPSGSTAAFITGRYERTRHAAAA